MKKYLALLLCFAMFVTTAFAPLGSPLVSVKAAETEEGTVIAEGELVIPPSDPEDVEPGSDSDGEETDPPAPDENEDNETTDPAEGETKEPVDPENPDDPDEDLQDEPTDDVPEVKAPEEHTLASNREISANTYEAKQVSAPIDLSKPISRTTWGSPTLSIDSMSDNAKLEKHDSTTPEDVTADLYFRWDDKYLYIGVKSPDTDITGTGDDWTGDGIQFHIEANETVTSSASDICLTMGSSSFKVRGSNADLLNESVQHNIIAENGQISMMVAIPHEDLGYTSVEVVDGAKYAINLLRISGRGGDNASDADAYSGWLNWGNYFNKDENGDVPNTIVLKAAAKEDGTTIFDATRVTTPIDLSKPISKAVWGTPTLSIDKNSYNTTLESHDSTTPEDVAADLYFRWDKQYLYIGVKSPDGDITPSGADWTGDGIQFKIEANDVLTDSASNICLTLGTSNNNEGSEEGADCDSFRVRGGAAELLNDSIQYKIREESGAVSMVLAIPHEDLGYSADEIEEGATYAISLLRISGKGGANASEADKYSGWLNWGNFFGNNNDESNVIVLRADSAVEGTTDFEADRTATAIDFSKPISKATWGDPTLSIDKYSFNTTLEPHDSTVPEDVTADLYFRWDAKYLYIGVRSEDENITPSGADWTGDGIQFKLEANSALTDSASNICLTLGTSSNNKGSEDGADCDSFRVRGGNAAILENSIKQAIREDNGVISMMLAIPHEDMGYTADEIAEGVQYAISLLRISGKGGANASGADKYSGWLNWGNFFGTNDDVTNTITLKGGLAINSTSFEAEKVYSAPDMNSEITEATWGTPTLSIDKDSFNTQLENHDSTTPEDVTADLYFRWDKQYLYIGVKSPDADITGTKDDWTGDGIQFKIEANDSLTDSASNICLTMGSGDFKVRAGNADVLNNTIKHKIIGKDGSISMMLAIPHTDMGLSPAEVKSGAVYSINLLRISGKGGDNASDADAYSGWLNWGNFFGNNGDVPNTIVLKAGEKVEVTSFEAQKTSAIDVTKAIDEAVWGAPVVSIDKDSFNTQLENHDSTTPEDVTADLYFRWDKQYLYIGVTSPDDDPTGTKDDWTGDGIQFKVEANDSLTDSASNICLTLGSGSFKVRGGNADILNESIKQNIVHENGVISMTLAIPHKDMGYTAADVKNGAKYSISLLRISGKGGDNASDADAYSGWLNWGNFFGGNGDVSNTIVLFEEEKQVKANRVLGSIIMSQPITEDTWGTPSLTISKDSDNTTLENHDSTSPEDVTADLFFRWDDKNLYIGVRSADGNVTPSGADWTGDGIQFKIEANDSLTDSASNICLTLGTSNNNKGSEDGADHDSFNVRGGNAAKLKESIQQVIREDNGVISMMLAIPHEDMGLSAEEIKSGTKYAISLLRISGKGGANASGADKYSGWLNWGNFFGGNDDTTNIIVLDGEAISLGNIVVAEKVAAPVGITQPISEATWGVPTLSIDKDSFNTKLENHDSTSPEDVTADLYFRWDADYLYVGVKSPDADITGTKDDWTGDGIQFKIEASDSLSTAASDICLTMGSGSFKVRGGNADVLNNTVQQKIIGEDGSISMMLAIPHKDMGYTAADIKSGATYAISLIRISGKGGNNASDADAYSGWLNWGNYFGKNGDITNLVVLYEKDAGIDGPQTTSSLLDISAAVAGSGDAGGFADMMKVAKVGDKVYSSYMTRSNTFNNKNGIKAQNEFALYEISGESVISLGRFYTRAGDVDVLADAKGNVFVVGGSSDRVIKGNTLRYNQSEEKAVLDIWTYTDGDGVANGRTSQKAFPSVKNYSYLTSAISADGASIYSFYQAGSTLTWFTYDIASQKWVGEAQSMELSGTAEKSYVFNKDGQLSFVYAAGGKLYEAAVQASASSTELLANASDVKDVYLDTNGKLCILYAAEGTVSLKVDGTDTNIAAMGADDYGRLIQNSTGALNILAMEKGKPATVKVLSATGASVNTVQLSTSTTAVAAPIIYAPRGGAQLNGTVSMVFPGKFRVTNHWYYAEIALG